MSLGSVYLASAIKRLSDQKELAEKTFAQLQERDFYFTPNSESNSIAIIIQHLAGNMLSRWTNFLTEDGEKAWRNRDGEFENQDRSQADLIAYWNEGWAVVFDVLNSLTEDDLLKTIRIRGEQLSVVDAINRQLAHYPHHVGQIVYLGKMLLNERWHTLSIPRKK